MAKQKGPVKLSGTIGEISFYEANNEFLAAKAPMQLRVSAT